jgi:hypothetical protein
MKVAQRKSIVVGVAWAIAAACAVLGIAMVASAGNPDTGVLTNTSQPLVGDPGSEDPEGNAEAPPAALEDGLLHATIDGEIQADPLEDGAVVDSLGRDDDGSCREGADAYGVARLDMGGPDQGASISLDKDTCDMVAHLDGEGDGD